MNYTIIIPARLNSTRLPRKALYPIAGKPMIAHVVERALDAGARRVIVATDSAEIRAAISAYAVECVMTDPALPSGTDRLAAACAALKIDDREIIVNVQGDEPLTPPACVRQLQQLLADTPSASIATLAVPITHADELFSASVVKVVRDRAGFALYFSRAPIPWARDGFASAPGTLPAEFKFYRHVGMYAYRCAYLKAYAELSPAPMERAESLEQLRALYHGHKIVLADALVTIPGGVDTLADIARVRALLEE